VSHMPTINVGTSTIWSNSSITIFHLFNKYIDIQYIL
jgi:hypothetical protein